ncbi:MAG: PAS domain S-box protein [Opitutaceae bacterium]
MFLPSCTLRRRVMEAGAAAAWPGFAVGSSSAALPPVSWGWLVVGVGILGLALAGWTGWKRRRRETAADRHWRRVLEKTDSMVWEAEVRRGRAGLEWDFTFVQPSRLHKRLLGARRVGTGESLWPGVEEAERAEMDRRSAEALLTGKTGYEREFRVQADGRTYWLHETVAIEPEGAERWRLTAVVSDTTARHEADEARRQSEQRLERLAAEMHALLWQARVRRRATGELAWELFVPRSELYRALFGEEPGAQPQLRWAEAGVPELEVINANARAALLEGRAGYEQVFHVPRPGGDVWLREQVTIRPLGPDEWALAGVVVDVTQQRQAEEYRREEEAQLQQLLSAANCLLWRGEVRRLVDGTFYWNAVTSRSVLYQQIFGDPPAGTPCLLDWRRVTVPENAEMDARATAAVLGGAPGYSQDFRVLQPRRVFWLHEQVTIAPMGADAWRLAGVVVDMSARREAEEAQRSHQTQIASILRAVDCMLWQARVIDTGGGALHWTMFVPPSGLYREVFDEDPSTPTYFRWERVVDAATDRRIDTVATRAVLGGETGYTQEFSALAADGRRRWLHEKVAIEAVGKGEWKLVGVVTDATPRRAAEEAKREHERQLERIFSVVECLLWRAEVEERPGGEFVWLVYVPGSALYHKLFGPAEPDPRTALNWDEAGVTEYPEMNRRSAEALRSGAPGYEQEFRASVGGRSYWLFERVSIRRTAYDRFEVVGVIIDISNQKRAEAELAAEKERLAVTLRAMAEGVVTTDLTGRVQFINPAAAALTRWPVAEAVGRPLDEICQLRAGEGARAAPVPLASVLRGDVVIELPAHAELLLRDGERRFVEGCCAPIHAADSSVTGAVLVFRDVTERERLEQELGRASKLESVGLLAGGIAHDFNNILTAVLGNLALGLLDVDTESELGRTLRDAERAALRARDLTQQLLTFARGGDPVRAAVRLPEILTEATRFALHGAKVKAEFDLAPDLWPADVDKAQIGRVVQNLVLNAVQAMPAGGTVRIVGRNRRIEAGELPSLAPGAYLQLAVSDTGSGIRPEHLARVFEPYFTTKQTGSGLGLATVYSIVRKHKGHVAVESTFGRGSTFLVHLPAAEHGTPVAETTMPAVAGALRARVLFMDDEAPIRQLATALLRRLGCAVEVVADGAAAVERYSGELAAGRGFDVVVMDLTIPGGMGGIEALERIRAVDPQVRAIVSSGYSSDPVLANYRDYGFRGRVAKPYEFAEFGRVLRDVLGGQ